MTRIAILALVLVGRIAAADAGSEPYWLHGTLDEVTAKLGLRYRLEVQPRAGNSFQLQLPIGAVATGATIIVDGVKHHLALEGNSLAGETYTNATTGSGPHKPWAVQLDRGLANKVALVVAAPRATTVTFDLEVEAATCFHAGARYLAVPASWASSIDRSLASVATRPCGTPETEGGDASSRWLQLPTRSTQRIATIAHRIDVPHGHFGRIEVDLARQISEVPADLATVILVDASRSVTAEELETQAKLVDSYVRQAPRSQIQVIAFARTARALLPSWTNAALARPRLAHALATLGTANGSNLDIAIVEANHWLARATGTRRVIVLTDDLFADRVVGIQIDALRNALPPNTLVHVVALGTETGTETGIDKTRALARADNLTFSQLAIATEGAAFRVNQPDALELLRPIALERAAFHSAGWTELEVEGLLTRACSDDDKEDLLEGSACVWWGDAVPGMTTVALEGLLWNHKFSRAIMPEGAPRTLARLLTGFGATLEKTAETEIRRAAEAVNEDWSLIAIWGGSDGYEDEGSDMYGGSFCGCDGTPDSSFGFGRGALTMSVPSISVQITKATAGCHLHGPVKLSLELTRIEIADFTIEADPVDRACVTDAVWATSLRIAAPQPHQTVKVTL